MAEDWWGKARSGASHRLQNSVPDPVPPNTAGPWLNRDNRVYTRPSIITLNYIAGGGGCTTGPKSALPKIPLLSPRSEDDEGMEQIRKRKLLYDNTKVHLKPLEGERPLSRVVATGFPHFLEKPNKAALYCRLKRYAEGYKSRATTATPAPFSSTDLVGSYNNDTNRLSSSDELRMSNSGVLDLERERRKSKDFEKRPSSRKESKKSSTIHPGRDKTSKGLLERDPDGRDRHKVNDGSVITKNYFKPTGLRNNFVGNHHVPLNHRTLNGTRQESDGKLDGHLVAMGTNWNPSNQQRSNGLNGGRPSSFSSPAQMSQSSTAALTQAVAGAKKVGKTSTMPHISGSRPNMRETEPRYTDPFHGASAAFQQRIAEIASLEAETIRWERTRKVKKKAKEG